MACVRIPFSFKSSNSSLSVTEKERTVMEEHKLQVSENKVLRKLLRPK
jgi:hypothetical protein